ncbi:hypothetical protein ABT061_19410 [Streptosporangium sp. NPDC002544]|uniref:TlpA family protein disulfide reductase n=1 Tax=Streptosporangium sp. NPDC002544 TaxID=3154538 RepID=UPI0033173EAE
MSTETLVLLLWIAVFANSFLLFRVIRKLRPLFEPPKELPEIPSLPLDAPAPPFDAESIDGAILSLRDFAESSVTLVFVSQDCAGCRAHFPNLEKINRIARVSGTRMVLVGFTDSFSPREARDVLRTRHQITADIVIVARRHVLRRLYNPRGATPFFYHVEDGVVRRKGGLDTENWAETVKHWQALARSEGSAGR